MQYTTLSEITPEPLKNVCLSMKSEDCFFSKQSKTDAGNTKCVRRRGHSTALTAHGAKSIECCQTRSKLSTRTGGATGSRYPARAGVHWGLDETSIVDHDSAKTREVAKSEWCSDGLGEQPLKSTKHDKLQSPDTPTSREARWRI